MSTRNIIGQNIEFDDDGFMVNPQDWSPEIAVELAKEVGIEALNDRHWVVIEFYRAEYAKQGQAPSLRRITLDGGIPTKELYVLFPKKPAKKIAKIAGLKKPKGCI